tara:strand:+ start:515 stop:757 length:243 start_codon:yes stop_codon:yes gene_type:complete
MLLFERKMHFFLKKVDYSQYLPSREFSTTPLDFFGTRAIFHVNRMFEGLRPDFPRPLTPFSGFCRVRPAFRKLGYNASNH